MQFNAQMVSFAECFKVLSEKFIVSFDIYVDCAILGEFLPLFITVTSLVDL